MNQWKALENLSVLIGKLDYPRVTYAAFYPDKGMILMVRERNREKTTNK